MIIVNLTPHEITVVSAAAALVLPVSGGIARVSTTRTSRPAILTAEGKEHCACVHVSVLPEEFLPMGEIQRIEGGQQ